MKNLLSKIKQSTVFLGFIGKDKPLVVGTGFLIQVDKVFYIVTAKHVVEKNFRDMYIFLNAKNFGINFKPIAKIINDGLSWKKHENNEVDIALLPFPRGSDDKSIFIPNELFIESLSNITELVDLFYLSFQPEINDIERDKTIDPIIRKGAVSRINENKTFYMDGFAFPGNSGSPVFLLPTPINMENGQIKIGGPLEIRLAGVIGAYVPYRDITVSKQTGNIMSILTENTGIALVHSTQLLREIINSDDFQEQHSKLSDVNTKTPDKLSSNSQIRF